MTLTIALQVSASWELLFLRHVLLVQQKIQLKELVTVVVLR